MIKYARGKHMIKYARGSAVHNIELYGQSFTRYFSELYIGSIKKKSTFKTLKPSPAVL